jgi:protein-disulfide isomerase
MAEPAAEAAEFAASHGVFWPMHDALFANQSELSMPLIYRLAGSLRLPDQDLRDALEAEIFAPKISSQFIGGVRSGVNGTPTFFIDGIRLDLPATFETLTIAIDGHLALHR